ncbi:MAG: flagellar hook assembly protein FlgD [Betaproteobacteria bacterium]
MSTVQSTTSSTATAATAATVSKTEESQNRFLKLLTAQLKNQDPMNPMDNAQMTSQLAQLDTVSGIERLNSTLNSLVDSLGNSQSMQAAGLIGKSVMVPGTQLSLAKGTAYGGFNLSSAADNVKVHIFNSAGTEIQVEDLGAQKAGVLNFAWDGKASDGSTAGDGTYKFSIEAKQGASSVTIDPLQIGTVSALVKSSSGFLLDLGSLGTFDYSKVQQVL